MILSWRIIIPRSGRFPYRAKRVRTTNENSDRREESEGEVNSVDEEHCDQIEGVLGSEDGHENEMEIEQDGRDPFVFKGTLDLNGTFQLYNSY